MTAPATRVVVHLSDLHFGRVDALVARVLTETLRALQPNLVAISGDLTQRARAREFRHARSFVNALPAPHLIVPGNHDVPLYNVFARLLSPLGGYTRFITGDLMPIVADESAWVIGINTARPSTWKSGRVNAETLEKVTASLRRAPAAAVKILVAHHPFDEPGRDTSPALEALTAAGIDVFLTGHPRSS